MTVVDLFGGGPSGWEHPAEDLGLEVVGIELDADACATRALIGYRTVRADLASYPPPRTLGGLIASPPCQDFSTAGSRAGRTGMRGRLVDVVPRWVTHSRPRWVACEQVPPVLPIWEEHAAYYRRLGYQTWTGILDAANFGVPQNRKRAILIASLDGPVGAPVPSHERTPGGMFPLRPWVSMGEALGFTGLEARYQRGAGMTERHGTRPARPDYMPAPTLTGSALGAGAGAKLTLHTRRDQRADGTTQTRCSTRPVPAFTAMSGGQWTIGTSLRLSVADALVLQGFPADLPMHGSKTSQFRQIGNAIPPPLARAVLRAISDPRKDAA